MSLNELLDGLHFAATKEHVPWTSSFGELPALSIRQPWAWLIANGFKDVENRGRRINYRGSLLIHAALNVESCSKENINALNEKFQVEIPLTLQTGGIVGMARLVDCANTHTSRWYVEGSFAWILGNAQPVDFQRCKGSLGLFKPRFDADIVSHK
jgi:ASCH domain